LVILRGEKKKAKGRKKREKRKDKGNPRSTIDTHIS